MLLHPLTNFEIQRYYQNEPKFNGTYSRNKGLNMPSKSWRVQVSKNPLYSYQALKFKDSQAANLLQQTYIDYKHIFQ